MRVLRRTRSASTVKESGWRCLEDGETGSDDIGKLSYARRKSMTRARQGLVERWQKMIICDGILCKECPLFVPLA